MALMHKTYGHKPGKLKGNQKKRILETPELITKSKKEPKTQQMQR